MECEPTSRKFEEAESLPSPGLENGRSSTGGEGGSTTCLFAREEEAVGWMLPDGLSVLCDAWCCGSSE